ncbi:EAL domain-containing protein [Phenylobacterium sp.]|jgi:cyclic-di-GMP phosphodiesterase TipF (flagellum assembly factor)|uniref:flagella assembly cyclic-di-GMP phosphodiesterase TipF n=1 Tax=Phenylobacterium sp. TaxID=1871053 RepID=UPI002F91D30F
MRRLTPALLGASYLCISLTVGLSLWRNGGGWGAGVSAFVASIGLCMALHGIIARLIENAAIRAEIDQVREAHKILIDQVERLDAKVTEVAAVAAQDHDKSEEIADEVHMLEGLVERLQQRLEERPAAAAASPAGGSSSLAARLGHNSAHRSTGLLMDTVREALTENRVDLYLQPIVGLPQRKTVFYESFSRLRDETGRVLMPAEYLSVAEPGGLVTAIDNLLLFRCVQIVRRLAAKDRRVGIFCNISMASLGDEVFFPQFIDLLKENRDLADALIFEIGQAAFDSRGAIQARNMAKLAELGFRFSLDKVVDLDLDLQDLARSDVKFIKVGAQMLLDELTEVDGRLVLRSLPDLAAEDYAALNRRYGVEIIAEKVEGERQVVDILELDIRYGQGHLFGEPRAIRDAVLAEATPPAPALRPQLSHPLARRVIGGRY